MADWTFTGVGKTESANAPSNISNRPWLLAENVITIGKTGVDQSTPVIDFLPYGNDWIVSVSGSATFASNAAVVLDYSTDKSSGFATLATTALTLPIAGTKQRQIVDNSVKGNAPYLKIRLDKTATMTATSTKTVTVRVAIPPSGSVVY